MRAKVVSNFLVKGFCYKLILEVSNDISARPGQFLMIRSKMAEGLSDPLLLRPFSIHRIAGRRKIEILYKVVGKGTNLFTKFNPGIDVDILGPLGNGFDIQCMDLSGDVLIVAGGIGVAPLVFLAETVRSRYPDSRIISFLGGKGGDDLLCVDELQIVSDKLSIATEEGSVGYRGYITDIVYSHLEQEKGKNKINHQVFACGPTPMLRQLATLSLKYRTYFSLEASMACGIGLCMGCAVKSVKDGYYLVCTDGPVFSGNEIEL